MKEDVARYQKLTKNNDDPIDLEELKPHKVGLPTKYLWFCLFDLMKNDYNLTLELLRAIEQILFLKSEYPPLKEDVIKFCAIFTYSIQQKIIDKNDVIFSTQEVEAFDEKYKDNTVNRFNV